MKANLILAATLVAASFALKAQDPNNRVEIDKPKAKLTSKSTPVVNKKPNKSGYAGMEAEIAQRMKTKTIPASFPKYNSNKSVEEYKMHIKNWMLKNPSFVDDKYLEKLRKK